MRIFKRAREYQNRLIQYIVSTKLALVFVDMRLGKTLSIIRALRKLGCSKILIISTGSALDSWEDELTNEDQAFILLSGAKEKRIKLLKQSQAKYFLLNYEANRSIGSEIVSIDWEAIVLDESHKIKNPSSKVSKFFTKNFRNVPVRICATGTPNPESDVDYIQQILFVNPSLLAVRDFWQFKKRFLQLCGFKYDFKRDFRTPFLQTLKESAFILKRKDVGLETIIDPVVLYCETTNPEFERIYSELKKDLKTEIEGEDVSTLYDSAKYQWLKRICGGIFNGKVLDWGKLNRLNELVAVDLKNEQLVIWCVFVDEIEMIATNLEKLLGVKIGVVHGEVKKEKRSEIVRSFQRSEIKIIVANPTCLDTGSNLNKANTQIWFSLPERWSIYDQARQRITSVSKKNVDSIFLVRRNKIDFDIMDNMKMKRGRIESQQRILKRL